MTKCHACGLHALNYAICDRWDCPHLLLRTAIEGSAITKDTLSRMQLNELPGHWLGPNDLFEISSNNSPDHPEDDNDEVHEPQDYTGDYPLEGDDGDEC